MDLAEKFLEFIKTKNLFAKKDKLLLAVSGGVDSVVLCELCKQAGYDYSIAHCNFQLRDEHSDKDEEFVRSLATKYGAEIFVKRFDTKIFAEENKKSVEETARLLRYEWFNDIISNWKETDIKMNDGKQSREYFVVTGHHADDNIETVIMNFFRGTGIKGLRGIEPKQNNIIRPLLFARRSEIEAYALSNKIAFVTDHTNAENIYTRNLFRNQLIPEIQKVYPGTESNILHNIERLSEAEVLYRQALELHKKKLIEHRGNEIHIPVLKLKKSIPLATIVYEIIKEYGFSAAQTKDVIELLDADNSKFVSSSTHRVIKNRKWLIINPKESVTVSTIIIDENDREWAFENGKLTIERESAFEISSKNDVATLDESQVIFPLVLRKWKTGDYFYPLGMKKKKKLSRFFIDQKLSKTQKENVWVLESNRKILWVVGHRIDDRFKLTASTKKVMRIEWLNGQTG